MFIYPVFMAYYVSKESLLDAVLSHKNIYTQTLYVVLPTYLVIGLLADIPYSRIISRGINFRAMAKSRK